MEKVVIEKLPVTREVTGAKRWMENRGEFIQITYGEEFRHLVLFEIRKGFSRGSHFHEKKEEIFYVFSGKIRAAFMDMDTLRPEERVLEKGDRIRVQPRCGHLFYGLEDTVVVEYSPQVFDPEDSYRVDFEGQIYAV
jgi:dTDP-4-dehydrorhamnose 3,5-epimerase-like enzyme